MVEPERSIEELVERVRGSKDLAAALRFLPAIVAAVARLREENDGLARVVRWCHDNHGPLVQERAALTPKGGDRE